MPLNDCAPLAVAQELGLFAKYRLEVELKRELGWATIRDKIAYGELDAAHALGGLALATTFGLGSVKCECVSGLVLGLHGNAITLSTKLWEDGVRDAATLKEQIVRERGRRIFTFGVVFPYSSHNFLLREWLTGGGINPDRDVRIVVVPPPQMVANLKSGNLDGYCVGEPWNSVAVQQGIGWCAATSARLAPGHPEKILLTRKEFAEKREQEHLALIAALLEACAFCDRHENADQVMQILAQPKYLDLPVEVLGGGLAGAFDLGFGRTEATADFQIFRRNEANEPTQEKAAWIVRSILQSGVGAGLPALPMTAVRRIFRADIFAQARKLMIEPHNQETQLINV